MLRRSSMRDELKPDYLDQVNVGQLELLPADKHHMTEISTNLGAQSSNAVKEEHYETSLISENLASGAGAETYLRIILSNWSLLSLCFGVSLSGSFFGYDTGTIGGITTMKPWLQYFGKLEEKTNEYHLPEVVIGSIVASFHVGCVTGGFTIGRLTDRLGRKIPIAIACIVYMVGLIVILTSPRGHWYQFLIGRIILGLTVGANGVLVPMYLSEIAPPRIRGITVNLYSINITHAILIGYIADYASKSHYTDNRTWKYPLIGGFIIGVVILAVLPFAPESPRSLIKMGHFDKAKKCIAKMKHIKNYNPEALPSDLDYISEVDKEFLFLKQVYYIQETEAQSTTFWMLFSKRFLRRTVSGALIMGLNQLSGVDYFLYYGTKLFNSVGLHDPYITSIIMGSINAGGTWAAIFVADNFGRRRGLLWGSIGCFVCLTVFSTIGVTLIDHGDGSKTKLAGIIMVVSTCIFLIIFCCSWAVIAPVLLSEIFTLQIKSKGMAFSQSFNWGANFFIALCTPFITAKIGYGFGFVFAGSTLFSVFFVLATIPETKGMSLEEIDEYYEKDSKIVSS